MKWQPCESRGLSRMLSCGGGFWSVGNPGSGESSELPPTLRSYDLGILLGLFEEAKLINRLW